jgi:hypothetical protein
VPKELAGGGELDVRRLGDAEVHDLRLARVQQHHVGGLHVAVHDAVLVRVVERARELGDDGERLAPGRELSSRGQVREGLALQVLERHVEDAVSASRPTSCTTTIPGARGGRRPAAPR